MKKAVVVILCVLMLFTTACGKVTEKDKALVRGTIENNVYTSEYAGFTFTPGDSWTFASEDEILAMMDLTAEDMDDKEKAEFEIGKQKTIYEAMVANDDGASLIIMYENLALTIGGTSYDEAAYAEVLTGSLKDSGLTSVETSDETVKIGGSDYYVLTGSSDMNGIVIEQKYLLRRIDNYMLCICITTVPGYTTSYDDILKLFA